MSSDIRSEVIQRFRLIATAPHRERTFPVGPDSAKALGYDPAEIDALPLSLTESFAGVGHPLSLGGPGPGQTVLDLGSGAGLDSILAARRTGHAGTVLGVDMTREMVAKARSNAVRVGAGTVAFLLAVLEDLPLASGFVDLAISNGVFNLCPDKPRVLREVCRVLRPGGRLQMADILLEDTVSAADVSRMGTWSD